MLRTALKNAKRIIVNKKFFVLILFFSVLINIYLGAGVYWLKVKDKGFLGVESALTCIPADILINAFLKDGYVDSTSLHKKNEPLSDGMFQIILTKNFQSVRITQKANIVQNIKIDLLEY